MKIQGIYKIINNINKKIYIGSSIDIYSRWHNHSSQLNLKKHINKHLQASWNKYKQNNFSFAIIEETKKYIKKDLFILEAKYITSFNTIDNKIGYNKGIPNEFGHNKPSKGYRKLTDKQKNTQKNKIKRKFKNVIQINKVTGKFIKEFETSGDASRFMGYPNNKKIQRVLSKGTPSYKGYVYVYKKDYDPEKNYIVEKNRQYKKRRKEVYQYSTNNDYCKKWKNLDEVILANPTYKKSGIYDSICRKRSYKGFMWTRIQLKNKNKI